MVDKNFNPTGPDATHQTRFVCPDCSSKFKSQGALTNHVRRFCGATTVVVQKDKQCLLCPRSFDTFIGLRIHHQRTHPAEYNEELEQVAGKQRNYELWTDLELEEMARLEAAYEGKRINQHLATIIGRSADSVRYKRSGENYKSLVIAAKANLVNNNSPNVSRQPSPVISPFLHAGKRLRPKITLTPALTSCISPPNHTTSTSPVQYPGPSSLRATPPKVRPSSHLRIPSISSPTPSDTSSIFSTLSGPLSPYLPNDPVASYLENLKEHGSLLPSDRHVIEVTLQDRQNFHSVFDDWVKAHFSHPPANKGSVNKRNVHNNEHRNHVCRHKSAARASSYRLAQIMFKKNRKTLASDILDGTFNLPRASPTLEAAHQLYSEVFSSESPRDNKPYETVDGIDNDDSYRPITEEDIVECIRTTKSDSPGPDGLKLQNLKAIPPARLAVLFNIMLFSSYVPICLKRSRTILLPKGQATDDINRWRPITISSILVRTIDRILARRLNKIPISNAQRGFRNLDGCLANNLILQSVIQTYRRKLKEHHILTLDLRKAFDLVSHHSIGRALSRLGIHAKTAAFIIQSYNGCSTVIEINDGKTDPIPMRRGVKQGDPLSPLLFNFIIDELLTSLPKELGLNLGDATIPALAYADDLVIMGGNTRYTNKLLKICTDFFEERGMSFNTEKCTALSVLALARKKKLYTSTKSRFSVNNTSIRQIGPVDQFKYLGFCYGHQGITLPSIADLQDQLHRLQKSPLKPQQKFLLLKQYLLPRHFYSLQNPKITGNLLKEFDRIIRIATRAILHLNRTSASAYLHASVKDGGLGITCLQFIIPATLNKRISTLESNDDAEIQAALHSSAGVRLKERLTTMLRTCGSNITAIKHFFKTSLDTSYSGNGLHQGSCDAASSSWVSFPPPYMSGRDYVKTIQLRGNLLPTKGIPSNPPEARMCRAGCARVESLSHVLQGCPATHTNRIRRHNHIADLIIKTASSKGWTCQAEPHYRTTRGVLRKPDIVCTKGDTTIVCDVAVHWEGPRPLLSGYMHKSGYYSEPETAAAISAKHPNTNIRVLPFILGARGTWCAQNNYLVEALGLPTSFKREAVMSCLKGGLIIHWEFGKAVWRPHVGRR